MTNKSRAKHGLRNSLRFRLNPTTRAIRTAFAVGLALAVSAPVLAGTCNVIDPTHIECDGAFTVDDIAYTIDDLTLVVGGNSATTIDPVAGTYGISVDANGSGTATVTSYADITTTYAAGMDIQAKFGAFVTNNGAVHSYSGDAYAADADAGGILVLGAFSVGSGDGSNLYNTGTVEAIARSSANHDASAYGVFVYGGNNQTYVSNTNSITAKAYADAGTGNAFVYGVQVKNTHDDAAVYNSGDVYAYASVADGETYAYGVYIRAAGGIAGLTNAEPGVITGKAVSTGGGDADVIGVYVKGTDSYVHNYGGIYAIAQSSEYQGVANSRGIDLRGTASSITNSGTISAVATSEFSASSRAINLIGDSAVDETTLDNSGTITATATLISDSNSGSAQGVTIRNNHNDGTARSSNSLTGVITASAYSDFQADALGIGTYSFGDAYSTNSGDIIAYANGDHAAFATGVVTGFGSTTGNAYAYNDGDISATAISAGTGDNNSTIATGIVVNTERDAGTFSTLINLGDIAASATSGGAEAVVVATGAVINGYASTFENKATGVLTVTATSAGGNVYAYGAQVYGKQSSESINDGSIYVSATTDLGDLFVYAVDVQGLNNVDVNNSADVTAVGTITTSGEAFVTAIRADSSNGSSYVYNSGDLLATAYAKDDYAWAAGISLDGDIDITAINQGNISASASIMTGTYAEAFGIAALGPNIDITNGEHGVIEAYAYAYDGVTWVWGVAGWNSHVDNEVSLLNDGAIYGTAMAVNGDAHDYTVSLYAGDDVNFTNTGTVYAYAGSSAGTARATGVVANSQLSGKVTVINDGDISATAYGDTGAYAYAVTMFGNVLNTLVNNASGSISATADTDVAIRSDASTLIQNYGSIEGSISTGDRNDVLYNGDGASITLSNDYVDLGSFDLEVNPDIIKYTGLIGNTFVNEGTIYIQGDSQIDMGDKYVDAQTTLDNPFAFTNYGTLDFSDGDADDTLTLYGNLAGDGHMVVDLDGAHSLGDTFHIVGSIVDITETVVTVDSSITVDGTLLTSPTTENSEILVLTVDGDSLASDVLLGNIATNPLAFTTFDFSITSDIDATNATADVFKVAIDVTGLSDRGVLASSIAPGVQNLWHAGAGTVFQREGTVRDNGESGLNMWARIIRTDGDYTPEQTRNFGSGGAQDFAQKNTGAELGASAHFMDTFTAGVLFANTKAEVDPTTGGRAKIDADTYGIYGTWRPGNGFYVDAAYRTMDFSVNATGVVGPFQNKKQHFGNAKGMTLEAGYAWTLSNGLVVEPQLQYSNLSIDFKEDLTSQATGFAGAAYGDFNLLDGDSQRTRVGVSLRKKFSSSEGHSWTPYVSINSVRESSGDNSYSINNSFLGTNSLGGNNMLLEAGATAQSGAWTFFGGLHWEDGGAVDSVVGGQLGARYTFDVMK